MSPSTRGRSYRPPPPRRRVATSCPGTRRTPPRCRARRLRWVINPATFARAAVSGQIDAKRLFHPTNSNSWKWIELSVDRRTISFDRALFEHFGIATAKTIWSSCGVAPSHPRTSHEKDGSFDACNSGAARRCINFFVCRGRRSAADVFPWELPRKIAAPQSKN